MKRTQTKRYRFSKHTTTTISAKIHTPAWNRFRAVAALRGKDPYEELGKLVERAINEKEFQRIFLGDEQ